MTRTSKNLLSNAAAVGAGNGVDVTLFDSFSFMVEGTGITSGGTMKIQALSPSGNWIDIDSRAVTSAAPNYVVNYNGPLEQVRANLSARTDGTYSVNVAMSRRY